MAAGEVPSLIDSETVITSEPTHLGDPLTSPNLGDASKGFGRDIVGTLALSSLLPALMEDGTDSSPLINRNSTCLPLWEGSEHDALGCKDDLLACFDEGWAQLAARAAELAEDVPPCVPAGKPLSPEAALEEACDIFMRLDQLVIESPSGEASWLFRSDYCTLIRSSVVFGNGLGGVAAFLAALAPRTRDARIRSLALERLAGCLDRIDEVIDCLEVARIIPEHSALLGMADGLGGVLCALDLVCGALDADGQPCPSLRERACGLRERFLGLLPRADVEHAAKTDIYAGASGLLLALAKCPAASGDGAAAALAERLVRRVLELRSVGEDGRLWDTLGTAWSISGFGHGQAGVAAALAKAAHAFGIDAGTAVQDALAFELAAYNERIGTWPDLRENPASDAHMHGMCSGAPGVGLAALMVRESTSDPQARDLAKELQTRADAACETHAPLSRDVLCCGNLSVVEYLLERGEKQGAGRLLAGMVHRKQTSGSYVVNKPQWRQTDDASFLWGHSGIAYLLLRYADPALASVF